MIKQQVSVKYLGVLIDCHLLWKDHIIYMHIHQISSKLSRGIGLLGKIKRYVDVEILVQLYHVTIFPFLSYGCIVWGNSYDHNIKPLQRIKKKVIQ